MRNVIETLQSMVSRNETKALAIEPLTEFQVAAVKRALASFIKNRRGIKVEADGSFTVITDLFKVMPEADRAKFMLSYLKAVLPADINTSAIRIRSVCPCERLHG